MLNGKVTKSIVIMCLILLSTLSPINMLMVNAVDKTTYYSGIFYVTEQTGDAYYLSGYEFRNNSSLGYLKDSTYDTYTGFRFTSVTILGTAIIDHAYLSLYSSDTQDNYDYMVTIYGEDVDTGNDFVTSTDLTDATLTTSHTGWNMKDLESNQWENSTDIKSIVQEVIDRAGWSSGNNLSLISLGAISANGYRSFRTWDYDGGHTYRAKLYVNYHTSEPVTSGNPWDTIDIWDNHILLNETNGYIWWEVWNGTTTSGIATGWLTTEYMSGLEANSHQVDSTATVNTNFDKNVVVGYNGDIYFLGIDNTDSYLKIYKSVDEGVTWSIQKSINTGATLYQSGICINENTGVIHIAYASQTGTIRYYRNYTIGTDVLSNAYTVYSGGSSGDRFGGIYYYNNVVYYVTSKTTDVGYYKKVIGTWTWYPVTVLAVDQGQIASSSYISADGLELYIIYKKNYDDYLYGKYVDHDDSLSSEEVVTTRDLETGSHSSISFNSDTGALMCAYLFDTNDVVYVKPRTASKTGSWGSETLIKWKCRQTTILYGTSYDEDGFVLAIGNTTTSTNKAYVYSSSGSLLHTFTTISAAAQIFLIFSFGSEGIHYFVLTDPNGDIVEDGIIPEFPPSPLLMNTTINNWLFKGEVYELKATVQNTNEAEFNLTDGYHTMIFYYNNLTTPITHKVYTLDADGTLVNEDVIGGVSTSHVSGASNTTSLTWKFVLGINVIDILNTTITYNLVSWNMTTLLSVSITGVTNSTVNIYNLGGKAEYQFSGDGEHIIGGHPFELSATNSSLVSGGSYAESWLIYRRLQYVHLLAELDMDNEVTDVEHFEPLVNIGYAEYGIDYKLEGEESGDWIEGWKCRIYAQEINVGTYGVQNDMAYVKMYVFWYNRGDFVTGNEFYSFHQGYDITPHFPTERRSFNFWVDLWFDKTNSSTVFGGRVNAKTYGYYEDGSAWWFTSEFRPMIGNVTKSMILGNIKDADGNIIQSKRISLVRVVSKVAKTASGYDGLGDDNTYTLLPYETLEYNLATDRMEGINTPPMIDTGYIDLGGYGIWGFLINATNDLGNGFLNLTKLFLSAADTVLSWFGLPFGTFSNIITFLSILPTMLINFLNILYEMLTNVVTVIISGSSLFIMNIVGWVSVMLSTINLISNFITIFIDLFTGGYGTGVDIWTTYEIATWLSLIMLLLPLMWFQRLAKSEHPLNTIGGDIELIRTFATTFIGFFDWLFDKVLYIAQMFLSLIRG